MDTRLFALFLGAIFLVFNVIWALVRGEFIGRSYAKAQLPPPTTLAWGTALTGAVVLFSSSRMVPGGGAFFDPALGAGLPSSGVAIVSLGWIAALVDSRIRLLPTEITRIMAIEVLAGWLIFGFDTGFGLTEFLAPIVGALIWFLPLALGQATGNVGKGDLRLAPVLGFAVATSSVFLAIVGIVVTFLAAAIHGTYVAARSGERGKKIPLGPYLLAGAWVAWAAGVLGPILFV